MGLGARGASLDPCRRGALLERLILDTTVLVAAERGRRRVGDAIDDEDDVAIAAITAAELLVGVEMAGTRQRARRSAFVEELFEAVTIDDYTLSTARAHAQVLAAAQRVGRPRGAHDLIIAATALSSDRIVVTSDAAGFRDLPGVGVRLLAG